MMDNNNSSPCNEPNYKNENNILYAKSYDLQVPRNLWLKPTNWIYPMRRHMQEMIPNLFLGPYNAASRANLQTLLDHGITHIICVRQDIEANFIKPNFLEKFKYLVLDIAHTKTENIIQYLQQVKFFIDMSLQLGGRILVHGNAGMSRSAALVLAYIMETYELPLEVAYKLIVRRRCCINISKSLMLQLKEYEPIYQARKMLRNNQQSLNQCNKRTFDQIDLSISIEQD